MAQEGVFGFCTTVGGLAAKRLMGRRQVGGTRSMTRSAAIAIVVHTYCHASHRLEPGSEYARTPATRVAIRPAPAPHRGACRGGAVAAPGLAVAGRLLPALAVRFLAAQAPWSCSWLHLTPGPLSRHPL
jgi:hypothetical protein